MNKLKPVIARTPEELAGALGLPAITAKEWQVQHILLKRLKEVARRQKITHAEIAKRAGTSRTRVTAILNDDLQARIERSSDPHSCLPGLSRKSLSSQVWHGGVRRQVGDDNGLMEKAVRDSIALNSYWS